MKNLPIRLKREPLLDAVFEVRFTSEFSAASVLPGILFGNLDGKKSIEQLPLSQIPQAVRDSDTNMQFAPLSRLVWGQFYINIGDRSVSVGFLNPYPGWLGFKPAIMTVMSALKDSKIIKNVERYSLKYIDLIPATDLREQVSLVNSQVTLAGHKLEDQVFQIRLDIPIKEFLHAVQVVSSATATLQTGEIRQGLIVDVDTICNQQEVGFEDFLNGLSENLDAIHQANKEMFFDCLMPQTIKALEPEYE